MAETDDPKWMSLLLKEYEYHRTGVDKFDAQRLQIRNWAITVTGALIAVSFSAKVPQLPFVGVAIVILFGLLESIYMSMQHDVFQRSNYLEKVVNEYMRTGAEPTDYKFGVSYAYRGNMYFRTLPKIVFTRGRIHLTSFYLALILVAALAGTVAVLVF